MIEKILLTIKELKKTAYHHYGESPTSIIKFLYYGLFSVNNFIVFENKYDEKVPQFDFDPGYKVIMPTMEELEKTRTGKELPREFYYDRIHNIKTCFLALYNDEIAYIHWVYFKGDYSRFLKIGDNTAEINYATTLPQFRGRRLSGKMFAYATKHLQDMGYKRVIMICNENNPAVIKTFLQAGFKEIRRIKAIGPFNRKIAV